MPQIRVSQVVKTVLEDLKKDGKHTSIDSALRSLLKNHGLLKPSFPLKSYKRIRPCAEGCGKEVEVEELPGVYTIDIVFCSEECSKAFWERDKKLRAERGLPPLKGVQKTKVKHRMEVCMNCLRWNGKNCTEITVDTSILFPQCWLKKV